MGGGQEMGREIYTLEKGKLGASQNGLLGKRYVLFLEFLAARSSRAGNEPSVP